jgi:hypothetical protein
MKENKKLKYAKRHITKLYMLHRLSVARFPQNHSRACALCAVFLRHIWDMGCVPKVRCYQTVSKVKFSIFFAKKRWKIYENNRK